MYIWWILRQPGFWTFVFTWGAMQWIQWTIRLNSISCVLLQYCLAHQQYLTSCDRDKERDWPSLQEVEEVTWQFAPKGGQKEKSPRFKTWQKQAEESVTVWLVGSPLTPLSILAAKESGRFVISTSDFLCNRPKSVHLSRNYQGCRSVLLRDQSMWLAGYCTYLVFGASQRTSDSDNSIGP